MSSNPIMPVEKEAIPRRKAWGAVPKATVTEAKQPKAKIARSDFTRERPEQVTFERLIHYHDRTPQIKVGVAAYSELITGTEMTISAKSEKAEKDINEWIRNTNFYDKLEGLVTTILICGNALLEKLDENNIEDVMEVDMSTITAKKRNQFGDLEWYEQLTQNGNITKLGEGQLGKFIEFNLTNYSRQPGGRSIFYSLAIPRTIGNRTTPPLVEVLWSIEDAMGAIYANNAYPITTITYPGASDDYLEKESDRWAKYRPGDKRIQKIKPEIEFFETQGSQSKFTEIIDHIEKAIELGIQFPHDILTGDFTSRASSETTENIVMKQVRGYQRYICNKLKTELFDPLLTQMGYDPEKEELELSFTTQNVMTLTVDQVSSIYSGGGMTLNEYRDWLRTNTGMELPDDKELQDKMDQAEEENELDKKTKELEKKIEMLYLERGNDAKIQDVQEKVDRKLELIKEAIEKDKQDLAQKRIKTLEKLLEKVDNLG